MEHLLVLLAILACPVGMGVMMLLMGRRMRTPNDSDEAE